MLTDDRKIWCFFSILFDIALPLFGNIGIGENGFHRTFRNTEVAIDTLLGVDVEYQLIFVKALDRTDRYTVGIFAVFTGFTYNVSHNIPFDL